MMHDYMMRVTKGIEGWNRERERIGQLERNQKKYSRNDTLQCMRVLKQSSACGLLIRIFRILQGIFFCSDLRLNSTFISISIHKY